jgi:hypothetical protein
MNFVGDPTLLVDRRTGIEDDDEGNTGFGKSCCDNVCTKVFERTLGWPLDTEIIRQK